METVIVVLIIALILFFMIVVSSCCRGLNLAYEENLRAQDEIRRRRELLYSREVADPQNRRTIVATISGYGGSRSVELYEIRVPMSQTNTFPQIHGQRHHHHHRNTRNARTLSPPPPFSSVVIEEPPPPTYDEVSDKQRY